MESTSFTLSVKQEAAPRPKRKAKKRAVWPHLLMQAFLAAVLLYLGIMIAQSASIHTTGAGGRGRRDRLPAARIHDRPLFPDGRADQ